MAEPERKRRPDDAGPPRTDSGWRVEGAPAEAGRPRRDRPFRSRTFWWLLLGALLVNWVVVLATGGEPDRLDVTFSFFRAQAAEGNVERITARGDEIVGVFDEPVRPPGAEEAARDFETRVPTFAGDDLLPLLLEEGVVVDAEPPEERPLWLTIALGFGPTLLFLGLLLLLFRRMAAGAQGALGGLGRSRAQRYVEREERTTFADVAGIEEAEEELAEVVDFLENPDRYRRLGAGIPKGVLLSGPPGTGKTLLARAVAGEAGVPFFSLSASEFVEMVVGVGASRVRDLFQTARGAAPAIVFIDELDAIGRRRGGGGGLGGHDEREQTLNQILTEMDGFSASEGVIVIAATNRPETLDPALLRPGRFDRRVTVNPPDINGRHAILEVHARGVPLADGVDLRAIAADTPGMVGADLRNLVNEAALTAARRGRERVHDEDFSAALERIVLGAERKLMLTREERERTAYHEAGHALLGMLQPGADPVRKISIVPRGRALGVTLQRPEADRYGYTSSYLHGRIIGALGGRAAEQLVYEDVTTGAESDLEQVTALARRMVGRWGMSEEVGLVTVLPSDGEASLLPGADAPSERTRELVDAEVRRIVDGCYERALDQLREHRDRLDALAHVLLERESLDEHEIYRIARLERLPEPARRPAGPAE